MKICPACKESNHDVAEVCIMCGAHLPELPTRHLTPVTEVSGDVLMPREPTPPPTGTLAIAVYHDVEPRIMAWFPVETDMTLVGREDAKRGIFPDVDLGRIERDAVQAERVSREHLRILRRPGGLTVEVLPGSTGTQLNKTLLPEGASSPLRPGDRLILGGRVRLKLVQL